MSVTVRVPTVLQKLTDGRAEVHAAGQTVGDVLNALRSTHHDFVQRITTDVGDVKPFLNVFVNGEDIRFNGELRAPVRDGDELSIVPSVAGG